MTKSRDDAILKLKKKKLNFELSRRRAFQLKHARYL